MYGGNENAQRVAATMVRALRWLAAGKALDDVGDCTCFYDDGSPRYTTPDKKAAHRCGR